jgi:DNA repair and recombination RAD54-like protein
MLFQVTFVFTNQVDGKLVPIESISPKMRGAEEKENEFKSKESLTKKSMLFSQQYRKPLQSVLSDGNSFPQPLPRATMKSVRTTLKGSTDVLKTKISPGNQLPQKRLSADTVEHDDDFQ